ncbi:MAG: dTMP kinase, partial [Candidatus Eremiobacteraeota bacterium]|nr:dTMP kinase [Candidatus Eremiobacteraeota bacterium]
CEALLVSASRAQLARTVIQPALQRRSIVLCDRYCDSTVAYQGYGRGLHPEMLIELGKLSTAGVMPDLTFFIDIPVELSRERISARAQETGNAMDRMENEDAEFYIRVREGYLQLAKDCARIVILDGCMSPQKLLGVAMQEISNR